MSTEPLHLIAGAPDRLWVIGEIELLCYVLEGETRVLSQCGMFLALGLCQTWTSSHKRRGYRFARFCSVKIYQSIHSPTNS